MARRREGGGAGNSAADPTIEQFFRSFAAVGNDSRGGTRGLNSATAAAILSKTYFASNSPPCPSQKFSFTYLRRGARAQNSVTAAIILSKTCFGSHSTSGGAK